MTHGKGFIAALDQSGGSTPKALKEYGVNEDQYSNEDEMFQLVHDMRTRVVTSPSFSPDKILGAILFEQTMDPELAEKYTEILNLHWRLFSGQRRCSFLKSRQRSC